MFAILKAMIHLTSRFHQQQNKNFYFLKNPMKWLKRQAPCRECLQQQKTINKELVSRMDKGCLKIDKDGNQIPITFLFHNCKFVSFDQHFPIPLNYSVQSFGSFAHRIHCNLSFTRLLFSWNVSCMRTGRGPILSTVLGFSWAFLQF